MRDTEDEPVDFVEDLLLDGAVRAGAFRLLEGPEDLLVEDFVLDALEEEPIASLGGNEGSPLGPRS
jgi:hypothetical protein